MARSNKSQINHFIDFLQNDIKGQGPWIQRKEIAVWAAVVFYLSGFFIVTNFIFIKLYMSEKLIYKLGYIFVVLSAMYLFLYFIFIQFGFIQYAMIRQRSAFYWVMRSIENNEIPKGFPFTEAIGKAEFSIPEFAEARKYLLIRKKSFIIRLFLPYTHLLEKIKRVNRLNVTLKEIEKKKS